MQPYQQMLFYDRKLLLAAFWTAVIKAVDLNGFQFRWNKNKLTADKLFSNLNQRCITDRTKLIFLWKIKIFLCYGNSLNTPGIRCSVSVALFFFF